MELVASHIGIKVTKSTEKGDTRRWEQSYYITLKLYSQERIKNAFGLSIAGVAVRV